MINSEEFLLEIKDMLKYAIRHTDWSEVCLVVESINEHLEIEEKVDFVSSRNRNDDELSEDES